MSISKDFIRDRLYAGKGKGFSHMVVVCDSWDYSDFIIFVSENESLEERIKEYQGINTLYRIMEIYNYNMDLEYQLNEYRAMHKEVEIKIVIDKKPEIKRLEKLPNFDHSYSPGKIQINLLGYISFLNMLKIPDNMNGYIDKEGNFFPSVSISSTNNCYNNLSNISMEQFAEAFVYKYIQDESTLYEYKELTKNLNNRDILSASDDFLINRLGFAKFYRYIDASEYGVYDERSSISDDATVEQLILLQHLFSLNHNSSTNIKNKGIQYSLKLAQKMKG